MSRPSRRRAKSPNVFEFEVHGIYIYKYKSRKCGKSTIQSFTERQNFRPVEATGVCLPEPALAPLTSYVQVVPSQSLRPFHEYV